MQVFQKTAFLKILRGFVEKHLSWSKKRFGHRSSFQILLEIFRTVILKITWEQQLPLLKAFTEVAKKQVSSNRGSAKNDFDDYKIDFLVQVSGFNWSQEI